jgi:Domain of unknown function (DUF1918)
VVVVIVREACKAGLGIGNISSVEGGGYMEAMIGDKICIHGSTVGHPDKHGEIVEVHGNAGEPPYVVRFPDGHTRLLFPGPDAVIVPRQRPSSGG